MKPSQKTWITTSLVCLIALTQVAIALALGAFAIDGNFSDWAGQAAYVDQAGPDDEASPSRADITEFRAAADSNGVYLLKAWDNTRFNSATAAGVTVRGTDGSYYRVYSVANGNPGSVPLSTLDINKCTDSTCATQTDLCTGTACTNAQAGSSATWSDPFAGRLTADCFGTNCDTLDTAVELYIPWSLIGGTLADGQTVFLQFGSYPAGPAQAAKDASGDDGITCRNLGGTLECYPATPTAVTLKSLDGSSSLPSALLVAGAFAVLVVLTGALGIGVRRLNLSRTRDS